MSILIGYFCGCFLTAELVAKHFAGKKASELGDTGNPGMANIMASLGFLPGIITLAGDLGKCIAAGLRSDALFKKAGWIVVLYAGLGCTLGHDFPFWRKFRGGKGVATTSMAIVLYAFWPGLAANLAGMLVVFATKYLCIGGPVIPLVFMLIMLAGGRSTQVPGGHGALLSGSHGALLSGSHGSWLSGNREAALIAAILTILSIIAHSGSIKGIRSGKTRQTDVLRAIRQKIKRRNRVR